MLFFRATSEILVQYVLMSLALLPFACSVLPSGQLLLRNRQREVTLHFAPGSLSKAQLPEMEDAEYQRLLLPTNGETGCGSVIAVPAYSPPPLAFSVLLGRGGCSYHQKVCPVLCEVLRITDVSTIPM